MLYDILGIQLFLQPHVVPRREHSLTYENVYAASALTHRERILNFFITMAALHILHW
jgi:hypothetical protein